MEETPAPAEDELPAAGLAEQIAEDIREGQFDLPGFPEVVLRIQRKIDAPDSSAEDIVKLLSTEPSLAARTLQIANSAMFRGEHEITDLRTAVSRLGFSLVRSLAIAFAIQQLRFRGTYSTAARAEIETVWRCSVRVASASYLIAKHCTRINPDQALLAGLLHVLGRLYILMRTEGIDGTVDAEAIQSASVHQSEIGKRILASWGLPEALQHAVEHQDDLDYEADDVSVADVLIAAKYLSEARGHEALGCLVLERIASVKSTSAADALADHADELRALRDSLGE